MIIHHGNRYPFPDANVKIELPFDPKTRDPKAWGTQGSMLLMGAELVDNSVDFIAAGILDADLIFICSSDPFYQIATTVSGAPDQHAIQINWMNPDALTDVVYKVGVGPTHTFITIRDIIRDRAKAAYTIHWSGIWCLNLFTDFNDDETGDVYVIDPKFKNKMKGRNRVLGSWKDRPAPP